MASKVIVLVGAKGVGKSSIGRAATSQVHACFVDAEAIAKREFERGGGKLDDQYARRAHGAILDAVQVAAQRHPVVVFETTGASEHAAWVLSELRARHALRLVRVCAGRSVCTTRIAQRDRDVHVPVDPQVIEAMFDKVASLEWPWDLTIDNDGNGGIEAAIEALVSFISSDAPQ